MRKPKLWIPPATFEKVVDNTPLVSIDLIVTKVDGILVGKRINRPAKDTYFVPGGRICKDESLDDAFRRIAQDELGLNVKRSDAEFMGVFEHFYSDSTLNEDATTHYVVLAYSFPLRRRILDEERLNSQHSKFEFIRCMEMMNRDDVHENTKVYARVLKGIYPRIRKT